MFNQSFTYKFVYLGYSAPAQMNSSSNHLNNIISSNSFIQTAYAWDDTVTSLTLQYITAVGIEP